MRCSPRTLPKLRGPGDAAAYSSAVALVTRVLKRLVIGTPMSTEQAGHTLLAKRLALPIFASDALSSVAYATQEILLVLTVGGVLYLHYAPWVAIGVVVLMAAVVASYRQLVRAYPTGGGDYEVATKNIGKPAGVVVASALLVDYVMTVAVSVSSGVDNIISAAPSLHELPRHDGASVFVVLLAAVNLRGLREAGLAFAAPTYLFAGGVFIMIATGLFRAIAGDAPVAESAKYDIEPQHRVRVARLLRAHVLRAARVLVRLHRADRGRGDRQRRAGVQAAEGAQRADHPARDGRDRGLDVRRHHRAGADREGAHHRPDDEQLPAPGRARLRTHAATHRDRAGGERGVRRPALGRLLLHPGDDGADPGARREHRVQRIPAAGRDSRARPEPARPAQQPRRPARVQQRHPRAGRRRRRTDRDLQGRRHAADPALHHRRVHLVHARPDGNGAALEPHPALGEGRRPSGGASCARGSSTPSARRCAASCS